MSCSALRSGELCLTARGCLLLNVLERYFGAPGAVAPRKRILQMVSSLMFEYVAFGVSCGTDWPGELRILGVGTARNS